MGKQENLNYNVHINWEEDYKEPVYYNLDAELLAFKLLYNVMMTNKR